MYDAWKYKCYKDEITIAKGTDYKEEIECNELRRRLNVKVAIYPETAAFRDKYKT